MVARASAQPRTLPAVVERQAVDLAETQRAAGRPATALRDAAGNALTMNPDARYPLLQAKDVDVALAFDGEGTLRAMSPDTQEHRDFAARDLDVRAVSAAAGVAVTTPGAVSQLENTRVNRQLNVYGPTYTDGLNSSSMQIGAAGAPADRQIMGYDATLIHNLWVKGTIYQGANAAVVSEFALKDHVADITDGLEVVRALRPAWWFWKNPEQRDDQLHGGIYVDEYAEAEPRAVRRYWDGDPDDVPGELDDDTRRLFTEGRGYDPTTLLAHLVSAVQTLAERTDERDQLADQVAALTARLDRFDGGTGA